MEKRNPVQTQVNKTHKVMFCAGYQTGYCEEADVHQANRMFTVRHICAKCWVQNKEMWNHPENSDFFPNLNSLHWLSSKLTLKKFMGTIKVIGKL